ncbi:DUF4876 domain-containing protein [Olivibacter sp. SDN3]|uniref:DUF4876 domain-containing protein n=1 Tax=Olivibacter sp. SDN3 TaxID=2764720 RepID=UPI001650EFFE|nr:DUF4876 domain-containing protein [Olivibacter sp. SDN3]QNL48220.1 DUF4876 domain-containing protein [Olivibacter sp. SDN3]
MKKFLLLLCTLALFTACKRDNPDVVPVDLNISLSHALQTEGEGTFPWEEVQVTLINLRTHTETVQSPSASGELVFEGIAAGEYDVRAVITLSEDAYFDLTGVEVGADVTLNASATNLSVPAGYSEVLAMELVTGTAGQFVIKQVYYAGSDNRDGAMFRDQFVEIHNNTGEVLYADGLYIARAWGRQTINREDQHYQANGQLDWSQSEGMPNNINANEDYVYLRDLFKVPGSGADHPVQPGESIVIAQNALNHKVPFTDNNGREISVNDPDLTVDLSRADFEVYYGDIPGINPLPSDIDNPEVPNMEAIKYDGRDWILDNPGRDSYLIFWGNEQADVENLPAYPAPTLVPPTNESNSYIQLPVAAVMDAVEVQPNLADDRIPKKLHPEQDAGFTFVTEGSYSSQSVIRRTQLNEGGRRILQDTNNSSEDFVVIKANPGAFADE